MWVCKECGGEIIMWEDVNVTTKYRLHKNKKNPTKGKEVDLSSLYQNALSGYVCEDCGNEISDEMGNIEDVAEWIK